MLNHLRCQGPLLAALNRCPLRHSTWRGVLCLSTQTHDGPTVSETNRAEATLKRFWTNVAIERRGDGITVTLDKRPLKMPSGKPLVLPKNKALVAAMIAAEWDNQATLLKPHALPVTSLASRAEDTLTDEETRTEVREALLQYLDTDTICYFQDHTPQLEKLQAEHWEPLLTWAREEFGVEITKAESHLSCTQPKATKDKFRAVLEKFDEWEMAAMERATIVTKSFIIALALVQKHIDVEQASRAAQAEVSSQIARWGEVEDTHDVDFHDIRRQLGSAAGLLSSHEACV